MFKTRSTLLPLLVLPALVAFSPLSEDLGYKPEKGLSVRKTIVATSEMVLDEMSVIMDGNEMEQGADMEMEISQSQTIVLLDVYEEPGDGQPNKLLRTYESIGDEGNRSMSHPMMGDEDSEIDSSSDLEGKTVVFQWNDEDSEYSAKFPEGEEADEELLDGLVEDVDLRGFLPESTVSEGDIWEVDAELLRNVLAPGGDLKLVDDTESESMMSSGPQPSMSEVLGEMTGKVTCTYLGMRDEGGIPVAAIKIVFDVTSTNDLADFLSEQMADQEMPEGMDIEMDVESMDMEYAFEGEGELLWDTAHGVLASITLEGETTLTTDTAMSMSFMGQDQSMEQTMVLAGSTTFSVIFEVL